ncbi:hypothetical protein COLO4_14870 [Corchorus olitorius]|uniref:Uncharacterized protein n=1 Tax=Corchorus olitorius TaxID=93759 RepID=A0A1R3JQM8_9ROSI|nr:hypothetical protein COLO4_14870 [Corchorus olitorius]
MASSKSNILIFAIFIIMALTFSSMEVSLAARLLQESSNAAAIDLTATGLPQPGLGLSIDQLISAEIIFDP